MVFLALVSGWLAAALINYLADVLPVKRTLTRVDCLQCGKAVAWHDYLSWYARCSQCSQERGIRHWIVRVVVVLAAIWLYLLPPDRFEQPLGQALGFIILLYLVLVIVIDMEHRLILHITSLFGALLGVVAGIWLHGFSATMVGGLAGLLLMWLVYLLGIGFVRLMGRIRRREIGEEAMGFGDVVLGGVIGLLLGWPGILAGLVLTFVLGGVGSLLYLVFAALARKYEIDLTLPYGPFLALSVWILLFLR